MSDPNAHWPMHIVWPVVVKMNLIVAGPRPSLAHKSNQIWSGAWDLHTWVISCWNGVCEVQDKLQLYTCIFTYMWPCIMVVPALNSKIITCTLKISRGVGHDLMHGCCAHEWPDDEKLNLLQSSFKRKASLSLSSKKRNVFSKEMHLDNLVSFPECIAIDNLYDKDKRKVLVEGRKHCSHTCWVIVGIAGTVHKTSQYG